MADSYTNPWTFDSTGVKRTAAHGKLFVTNIVFSGYANAAHKCVLKDASGKIVATMTGNAALTPVGPPDPGSKHRQILGLTVDTLDSGNVQLEIM